MFRLCKETNVAEMSSNTQQEDEDFQQEVFEAEGVFAQDITLNDSLLEQVRKTHLTLTPDEVFKSLSTIEKVKNKLFLRKNQIITCVSTREYPLDIKDTRGHTEIPFVLKEEIAKKLSKIPSDIRKTISYIHVGSIKIMLKATFREGINSPVKMALLDRRMTHPQDAIFGAVQGNLAYGKLIFTCNPKIGVPLSTKNINSILCFAHEFTRTDLMREGDMPYSVTYKIGYSFTNSHHSMMFKAGDPISIEGIFKEIGQVSNIPFQEVPPLQSIWAMNLAPKPFLGSQPTLRIEGSRSVGPSRQRYDESSVEEEDPTQIDNWTYNPNWNRDNRAQQVALNRMSGRPNFDTNSVNSVSRRITQLSHDIA
jgi:hypothetical protein